MSYIFTQTFRSTKDVKHLVMVLNSDEEASKYAEDLLNSSVDVDTVRVSKEIGFVRKVTSNVWN